MTEAGITAPVRVCVLTAAHHPFDQRVFYKQAVSLAQSGYQVTLVGPAPAELRGEHRGVWLEALPVPASPGQRLALQRHLFRIGRRLQADIYHIHDPELLLLALALRCLGRRVVYDVHENFPAVALTRAWVPPVLRRPLSLVVDVVERRLAACLNGVVGVIEDQQPRFASRRFTVVRNYPRLEWFRPDVGLQQEAELIHVGSLSRERGAHFLLQVMHALRQTHPNVRLDALGPFHTRADEVAFHATVREFGLTEHVHLRTDRLAYDELGRFISRHQIGLIPGQVSAKNLTPFVPTKLFEYLACGVPVVASALPSIVALRQWGEWGHVVDPDDPAAHARAIAALLDNPDEGRRLGAVGRALVEERCNWEAESRKLMGFYDEVLGSIT